MKKLTLCIVTAFMLLTIIPTQLKAEKEVTPVSSPATKPVSAEVNAIMIRLNEIKAMDMSKLSVAEKKALRKEVREARSFLRSEGVYLSVGAIIIIILILILIL